MSSTKMYKLTSSETIVCEPLSKIVIENGIEFYVSNKPLQLIMSPSQEGIQMALFPWMGGGPLIKKDSIMAISDTPPQVEQQYIKMTTNIQIPTNNIRLVR